MASLFSKIIAGEIPCHKVYEDQHVLAFLDIQPHAKGHTLVIPKKEEALVENLDDETVAQLFIGVKKTVARIQEVLKPDAFNIGINNGAPAGQEVPHVHVHILPRYENDGGKNVHAIINNDGGQEVAEVAKLFA